MYCTLNLNQERSAWADQTQNHYESSTHCDRNSEQKQDSSPCWEAHCLARGRQTLWVISQHPYSVCDHTGHPVIDKDKSVTSLKGLKIQDNKSNSAAKCHNVPFQISSHMPPFSTSTKIYYDALALTSKVPATADIPATIKLYSFEPIFKSQKNKSKTKINTDWVQPFIQNR